MSDKKKFTYEHGGSVQPSAARGQRDSLEQASTQRPQDRGQSMRFQPSRSSEAQHASGQMGDAGVPKRAVRQTPGKKTARRAATTKKRRRGMVAALAVVGVVAVVVAALQLTGLFNFVGVVAGLLGGSPGVHSYTVDSEDKLVRYLGHPALKPGDTLVISENYVVDVDESFGSFAMLPLVNVEGTGSISFMGGTVVLSGAVKEIDMGKVSFSGTDLYIDAPETSLALGSAEDTYVNVASLNGTAHTRALEMPFSGTRMTIPVTLTNETSQALSDVEVQLTSAGFIFSSDTVTVESIPAGGSVIVEVDVVAVEGGRHEITAYAVQGGNLLVSGSSGYINVLGPGYYAGDLQTHTEAGDSVRYGTLEGNIKNGYYHGMSFITSVEVGTEADQMTQDEVDALVGSSGGFLQIVGGVTSQDGSTLELLILGTDVRPSAEYGEEIMDHGLWVYQDAINEVVRAGGLAILPHFFSYGNLEAMISMLKSSRGAAAMEIFTLDMQIDWSEMNYYYNTWAAVNAQGRQKMYGIFTSNNVYSEQVGTKYIAGYMPTLTEQNIYAMLQTGNYLMSNGPELRFSMSGVQMGGDIRVVEAGGVANVQIYAADTSPIETIRLLKYRITGNIDDIGNEVVYEEDFTGQGIYSFQNTFDLDVEPDTFYRVEVVTQSARNYEDKGLALSNPIYVYQGEVNSFCHIERMRTAFGGAVRQAPNGTYFIEAERLKTNAVNVIGTGESISIDYHVNGGDYIADFITVTMLGADGSLASYKIYVLNG